MSNGQTTIRISKHTHTVN